MADNVAITAGSGTSIAADDISSVFYQRVKIARGTDGVAKGDAGTFGSTTSLLSSGLNSLATSSTVGYVSNELDLTTEGCEDVSFVCKFTMTTAGSPTGLIEVYLIYSLDGTTYTGDTTYSGTAASYTLGAAGSVNLSLAAVVKPHANTNAYQCGFSLKSALGFVPPYVAVVVVNNSAIALHSSGNDVSYRARY